MAKTIHIHIHRAPAIKGRTGDSGNFDESKHKRDNDGKFSSGGGGVKAPGQNLAHGDPKKEAAAAHARIMEKQAARAANDPTKHFAPGSGPEAKAAAARLAAKHAERRAPASSSQGTWSATAHNATIAAAEDASNEAWASGSHKKAIAAFEKAIASTQQAIKVGSPKYAGERQQQLKRLQARLNHHKQASQ